MGLFSKDSGPSAAEMIAAQEAANKRATAATITGSQVNQVTPYGSLTYKNTGGKDKYGNPYRVAETTLTPDQQQLLDTLEETQKSIGGTASNLVNNAFGIYNNAPDLTGSVDSIVNQRMEHQTGYLQPFFTQQVNELDNTLRNQGLAPGTPAYDNAMRTLRDNQNQSVMNFLSNIQPQAFNQALTEYQLPMSTAFNLMDASKPATLPQQFVSTPQVTQAPVNAIGAMQQEYQNRQGANSGLLSGLFGLAGTVLGGPIGGSIGNGIGSLFGGGGGGLTNPMSWIPTITMG